MKLEQLTARTAKTIAHCPTKVYAWGALQVTLEAQGNDNDHYYITMVKAELVEALAKITEREEEIADELEDLPVYLRAYRIFNFDAVWEKL